ncbi:MAG: flagellar protein [Lachnospiraceae bacterium]|nr:flagellar protein [Lachnospiraceae bacterium]
MEVMNCKTCGRLFNYYNGPKVCPACKDALEEKFRQVKEYLREHKVASITEVSEANEVSVNQIKQWVREERLAFQEGSGVGIECENCGAEILTGRFCTKCKNAMVNELGNAFGKPKAPVEKKPAKDKDRMRFLDKQ